MTTDEVFKDFKIMANKKILENHKYEIYYSESEKSWRTYLPDETKPNKRRPVKRKQKLSVGKILTTITGLYIFTDRRPVNVH